MLAAPTLQLQARRGDELMSLENPKPVIVVERILDSAGENKYIYYERGRFLGKGGFAKCYELKEVGHMRIYAGKIVEKSSLKKTRALQKLKSEIQIHKSLNHPHIVKFERHFEDATNVYMLLEMCNHKSMMELIKQRKQLSEHEARYYLVQVIDAVKYMHKNKVIHRDLKLGNLFLKNMKIKIGDFGLATRLQHDGERKRTICGTPNYIAPEILCGLNGHSYEVDIWAIGVILYTLLIGTPPFETSDVKSTYNRIKANLYTFPENVVISDSAKSLIKLILHPLPECRPSLDSILAHPFFQDNYIPKSLPESALLFPPPARSPLCERTNLVSSSSNVLYKQEVRNPLTKRVTSTDLVTRSTKQMTIVDVNDENDRNAMNVRQQVNHHGVKYSYSDKNLYDRVKVSVPVPDPRVIEAKQHHYSNAYLSSHSQHSSSSTSHSTSSQPSSRVASPEHECDERAWEVMHQTLSGSFAHRKLNQPPVEVREPAIWVVKWVDYSNKYGLGYQLSDGTFGAYFNDATKMVTSREEGLVESFETVQTTSGKKKIDKKIFSNVTQQYPPNVAKKITLLHYFKNYLSENSFEDKSLSSSSGPRVYVEKWLRTKHAIIFRLSNKCVQVNFFDHTKVMLSSEAQVVSYINKKRERSTVALSSITVDTQPELVNRLKYIRDIFSFMLSQGKEEDIRPSSSASASSSSSSSSSQLRSNIMSAR